MLPETYKMQWAPESRKAKAICQAGWDRSPVSALLADRTIAQMAFLTDLFTKERLVGSVEETIESALAQYFDNFADDSLSRWWSWVMKRLARTLDDWSKDMIADNGYVCRAIADLPNTGGIEPDSTRWKAWATNILRARLLDILVAMYLDTIFPSTSSPNLNGAAIETNHDGEYRDIVFRIVEAAKSSEHTTPTIGPNDETSPRTASGAGSTDVSQLMAVSVLRPGRGGAETLPAQLETPSTFDTRWEALNQTLSAPAKSKSEASEVNRVLENIDLVLQGVIALLAVGATNFLLMW